MKIACLHTADVHVATFGALMDGPDRAIRHIVRPDLLTRAQADGVDSVGGEVLALLSELASADAVLCTCSTLGVIVDQIGLEHVLRIDRPAMNAALKHGPKVMLAICLDSTRMASLSLLNDCAAGDPLEPTVVLCTDAWAAFLAGDMDGFADKIVRHIHAICANTQFDAIVLAQASMQVAAPRLANLGVPVLTTPAPAAEATLAVAQARS